MKTISLKKVAAVAVASLGFGLLSVVPAQAAVSAVAITQPDNYIGKVGTALNVPVFATSTGAAGAGETIIITPTASATTTIGTALVVAGTNTTVPVDAATGWAVTATGTGALTATAGSTSGAAIAAPNNQVGTLVLTPTRPGTITITLTTTGTALSVPNPDIAVAVRTFTITVPTLAYDAGDAAVASPYNTGTGVAGVANTVTVEATSDNSVRSIVTVSGAGATISSATGSTSVALDKLSTILAAAHTEIPVVINTPTVGTITVSLFKETASAGIFSQTASDTVTITVNAAPALTAGGINSATTTAALVAGATAGSTADGPVSASSAVSAGVTAAAVVKIVLGQQSGAITGSTAISTSIVGPGTLILDNNDGLGSPVSTGRSLTSTITGVGAETFYVGVAPDGTSGVATVTITAGTYSVTKSVTFYGKVASLTATTKKNVVGSGSPTTAAVSVVAYDSNKVVVPSQAITITSGTPATIANFSATTSSAAQVVAGTATVDVTGVSGKFGSVVLTIKDTATGLISTTATVKVGAIEAATVTAAFDKASYTAGELVTLTLTAKDANAADVGDSTTASSLEITTNAAVQGTMPTGTAFVLGKQSITFFAPAVGVPLTASVKLVSSAAWATALDDTTITATAKVVDASAAIQTSIAALNAKIVALNALIAKIMKRLNIR